MLIRPWLELSAGACAPEKKKKGEAADEHGICDCELGWLGKKGRAWAARRAQVWQARAVGRAATGWSEADEHSRLEQPQGPAGGGATSFGGRMEERAAWKAWEAGGERRRQLAEGADEQRACSGKKKRERERATPPVGEGAERKKKKGPPSA